MDDYYKLKGGYAFITLSTKHVKYDPLINVIYEHDIKFQQIWNNKFQDFKSRLSITKST